MAIMQDTAASRYQTAILSFYKHKIPQTTVGTLDVAASNATAGTLNVKEYVMPYNGSIYAIAGNLHTVNTAGTLRIDALINGSLTPLNVDTTVSNAKSATFYVSSGAKARYQNFTAGQRIGLRYSADSDFAPTAEIDGTFQVYVLLENVQL